MENEILGSDDPRNCDLTITINVNTVGGYIIHEKQLSNHKSVLFSRMCEEVT